MSENVTTIVLLEPPSPVGLFSLEELAHRCGVHKAFIERLVRMGVVDPHPGHKRYFHPRVTLRIRKVVRLKEDLNVNPDGAAIILELLDRIEQLEAELKTRRGL